MKGIFVSAAGMLAIAAAAGIALAAVQRHEETPQLRDVLGQSPVAPSTRIRASAPSAAPVTPAPDRPAVEPAATPIIGATPATEAAPDRLLTLTGPPRPAIRPVPRPMPPRDLAATGDAIAPPDGARRAPRMEGTLATRSEAGRTTIQDHVWMTGVYR